MANVTLANRTRAPRRVSPAFPGGRWRLWRLPPLNLWTPDRPLRVVPGQRVSWTTYL